MRVTFVHWVLVLFLLSSGLPGELLVESPVKHAAEEDSSERQDESFKLSASRKRNPRAKKKKPPRTTLLATVWPSYIPFADDHRLSFSPVTPSNPNRHQLHQVFRI
jgi:hypothetical protein